MDMSPDGTRLAAGGGDFDVKIITLADSSQKVLKGHTAPILSVAFSPDGSLIASASCDGSVRIWSVSDATEVHCLSHNHEKSNDFGNSRTLARMSWSPDGKCLAVPCRDEILLLETSTWDRKTSLSHADFANVSICAYSKNGSILAASNTTGCILFWKTDSLTSSPVATFVHEDSSAITSLKFSPKRNEQIIFCDAKGKFSFLDVSLAESREAGKVQEVLDDMYGQIEDDDTFTEEDFLKEQEKRKSAAAAKGHQSADGEDEDEEEEIVTQRKKRSAFIDDEADEDDGANCDEADNEAEKAEEADDDMENFIDDDDDDVRSVAPAPVVAQSASSAPHNQTTEVASTDLIDDDDGGISINAIKAVYEKTIFNVDDDDASKGSKDQESAEKGEASGEPPAKVQPVIQSYQQPAFQPGSTPVHFEQRFMLWNETGIVRAYSTETEDTIDVEFHDVATHHTINMTNTNDYTIAALSSEALVLANGEADELSSSRIFCMNFVTWDESNKEWTVDLPDDEFAESVALGGGFVAVATNKRFIRLFTIGGTQINMFSIPGSVVCISAQEGSLIVVYNAAPGTKYNPVLSAYILKISPKSATLPKQSLPNPVPVSLVPDTLLAWAGFTDEGTPCVVDTDGYVRLMRDAIGNTWIPVVHLKEKLNSKTDNNFVIGLSEINEQVRCIFCKGSRYPAVIPRPHVTFVSFELPFCGRSAMKGKLEESHIRSKLANSMLEKLLTEGYDVENQTQRNYKSMNESLLRLFAMAIGSGCEALALEISYLMPSGKSVESAIRYALQKRCTALAEKLREVALEKENEAVDQTEPEPEVYRPSPRKSAVPVAEDEIEVLRPKPVVLSKNGHSLSGNDDSEEEEVASDPPPTRSTEQESGKKRKRAAGSGSVKSGSCKELGFDVYLDEVFESVKEKNPDMDDSEVADVAKDTFLSLPFSKRREYQTRSESSSQSKRSRTC